MKSINIEVKEKSFRKCAKIVLKNWRKVLADTAKSRWKDAVEENIEKDKHIQRTFNSNMIFLNKVLPADTAEGTLK